MAKDEDYSDDENYENSDSQDSEREYTKNSNSDSGEDSASKKHSKHLTHKTSHASISAAKKDQKHSHKAIDNKQSKSENIEYYDEGDESAGKILLWTIVILIVIGIVLGIIFFLRQGDKSTPAPSGVAATVSGVDIMTKDLDSEYAKLPDFYQSLMSKRDYLENVMIPQKILERLSNNIEKSRIEKEYQSYLTATNLTEEELLQKIKEQGADVDKFRTLIRIQIYLNDTLGPKVNLTDAEVREFYNSSVDMFKDEKNKTIPFSGVEADIRSYLYNQKLQMETETYLKEISKNETVKIYYTDSNSSTTTTTTEPVVQAGKSTKTTFKDTGDDVCTENGKPIIRLYSTTWCPHCKWIKQTFDETVKKYVDEGKIVAHHWEVDIKDDTLTDAVENDVPQLELDLFKKYSGSGSIPTFVFGCKYSRIGNGYEREGDLAAEKAEFESLIEKLAG